MSVEDRVRTATRARADLVRDIRPLDLPAAKPLRLPRAPRARGWSTWMAPVTAAAVVVALAITTVALREVRNEPSVSPAASAQPGTGATSAAAVPPKYYAALDDPSGTAFNDQETAHAVDVVVGDSSSAQPDRHRHAAARADVRRPDGSGGRPHVRRGRRVFPRARPVYSRPPRWPGTCSASLRAPPKPPRSPSCPSPGSRPGTQVSGIALSPERQRARRHVPARRLAVRTIGGRTGPLTLSVYSVSTGKALRTWTQQTNGFAPQATAGTGAGTPTARSPGWPTATPWRSPTAATRGRTAPRWRHLLRA